MNSRAIDLVGMTCNNWTVLSFSHINKRGRRFFLCRCKCGRELAIAGVRLRHRKNILCPSCNPQGKFERHSQSNSITYTSYRAMLQRCNDPNATGHHRYGGRGISVCERWKNSFSAFLEDVGQRPSKKYSVDRFPNPDGNYEPGNVRWATRRQQQATMKSAKQISHCGQTHCVAEWSRRLNISYQWLLRNVNNGWTIEQLLKRRRKYKNDVETKEEKERRRSDKVAG